MPAANVLSKKLRQGGVARSPLPDTDLIGETLARGVEDRLRPLVKTMLAAEVASTRVTRLSEARREMASPAQVALVDIEDAETPALMYLDSDLAYHLIDLTLGGDPSSAPAPVAREPHRDRRARWGGSISTRCCRPSTWRSASGSGGRCPRRCASATSARTCRSSASRPTISTCWRSG